MITHNRWTVVKAADERAGSEQWGMTVQQSHQQPPADYNEDRPWESIIWASCCSIMGPLAEWWYFEVVALATRLRPRVSRPVMDRHLRKRPPGRTPRRRHEAQGCEGHAAGRPSARFPRSGARGLLQVQQLLGLPRALLQQSSPHLQALWKRSPAGRVRAQESELREAESCCEGTAGRRQGRWTVRLKVHGVDRAAGGCRPRRPHPRLRRPLASGRAPRLPSTCAWPSSSQDQQHSQPNSPPWGDGGVGKRRFEPCAKRLGRDALSTVAGVPRTGNRSSHALRATLLPALQVQRSQAEYTPSKPGQTEIAAMQGAGSGDGEHHRRQLPEMG